MSVCRQFQDFFFMLATKSNSDSWYVIIFFHHKSERFWTIIWGPNSTWEKCTISNKKKHLLSMTLFELWYRLSASDKRVGKPRNWDINIKYQWTIWPEVTVQIFFWDSPVFALPIQGQIRVYYLPRVKLKVASITPLEIR